MPKKDAWQRMIAWENSKVRKMDVWDIQLIKLGVIGFTLMVAKFWEPILSLEWYWYALVFVISVIRPLKKVFG